MYFDTKVIKIVVAFAGFVIVLLHLQMHEMMGNGFWIVVKPIKSLS
jgi:hypothetical protein